MIAKLHKTHNGRRVLAICDKGLAGKKFEEKNLQLDLTSNFYKGEEKSENDLLLGLKSQVSTNRLNHGA